MPLDDLKLTINQIGLELETVLLPQQAPKC